MTPVDALMAIMKSQGPWVALVAGLLYVLFFHTVPEKVWKQECQQNEKLAATLEEMTKSMAVLLDRRA
jgi:hypothetical protein